MTPRDPEGRLDGVTAPDAERSTGSPAVAITVASGLVGLLLSLNAGGFAVALFFCAVALAALPMALADRPGGRAVRFALLGGLCAVIGLVLALVPQLGGEQQRGARTGDPLRVDDRPASPGPAPAPATQPAG